MQRAHSVAAGRGYGSVVSLGLISVFTSTFIATAASSTGSSSNDLFGANLLQLLVLAFGGALVVGNGLALVRPPQELRGGKGAPPRPPVARSVTMMVVGLIAAIWAIATLTS